MKQLTTLLLAVGLGAAGAFAQNVSVVLKDGSVHKFNADYISELSFKEIQNEPEVVQLTSADPSIYGREVVLLFKDAAGTNEVSVDFYGPDGALWLNEGTYSVNGSMDGFTVCDDVNYTYVKVNGEPVKVTSGQATVAFDSEDIYTIGLDFTLENGTKFLGEYMGKIDGYSKTVNAVLTMAKYNDNPQPKGDFYVILDSEDWNTHVTVVFTAESDATLLPAGTYTVAADRAPGTFSLEQSGIDHYNPNWNSKFIGGSSIVVEKDGGSYKMTFKMELEDGRKLNATFNGEITGTPTFKDEVERHDFTLTKMNYYNNGPLPAGEFWVKVNDDPDWTMEGRFDFVADPSAKTLPAGTYTYSESGEPGTFGPGSYIDSYGPPYITLKMAEGSTITVAVENGVYNITMDLKYKDGSVGTVTFNGEITGTPEFEQ